MTLLQVSLNWWRERERRRRRRGGSEECEKGRGRNEMELTMISCHFKGIIVYDEESTDKEVMLA